MGVFNLILDIRVMFNNDSCQKRIFTDQCHMTVSWALVYNSMLLLLFFFCFFFFFLKSFVTSLWFSIDHRLIRSIFQEEFSLLFPY